MSPRNDRQLTMPAGRVLGVIVIALVIAALFNSEAIVRAGEGMEPGGTRDVVLSIGRPLDDVAGTIGLHLPRQGLDLAFGQESKTAGGTELESGSTAILREKRKAKEPAPREYRQPTRRRPLDCARHGRLCRPRSRASASSLPPAQLLDVRSWPTTRTGLAGPIHLQLGGERPAGGGQPQCQSSW